MPSIPTDSPCMKKNEVKSLHLVYISTTAPVKRIKRMRLVGPVVRTLVHSPKREEMKRCELPLKKGAVLNIQAESFCVKNMCSETEMQQMGPNSLERRKGETKNANPKFGGAAMQRSAAVRKVTFSRYSPEARLSLVSSAPRETQRSHRPSLRSPPSPVTLLQRTRRH